MSRDFKTLEEYEQVLGKLYVMYDEIENKIYLLSQAELDICQFEWEVVLGEF